MSPLDTPRSEYTVLARRFRPQAFHEVVGQENVAQTLRNAIEAGRVGHAFLFTGARGVGKTSMARILAKSLNCPNAVGPDPCNQCEICQGISTGSDVDVLEIDGASNRGIDDIRSLRSNVNVRSMRSKHKVYIIDEVHMLTKEAFNALLKTLEEPPANVKFIFCTTEPNKLPDTILSRCQRFDFGTIATASIMTRLQQIAEAEGKNVERAAIELVARRAAGSMRDSQSLFDQLLAFGGSDISTADVHRLLGTAPDERLIELVDAIIERRRSAVLELFHAALGEGVQLGELTDQLLSYVRDLMILATGAKGVPLLSVADDNAETLRKQAEKWGLRTIAAALQILAETKARMQRVNYGRALAELGLVRLSLLEDLDTLESLIHQLQSGAVAAAGAAAPTPARTVAPLTPRPAAAGPAPAHRDGGDLKKKALTVGRNGDTDREENAPPATPESQASPSLPRFELVAGREQEFWEELLSQIKDILRDNLRRATLDATSGPNQLVLAFPKSYDVARTYCERQLSRLQQLAAGLAGRPIRIAFKTVEGEPVIRAAAPKPQPEMVRRGADPGNDPLVLKALAEFGGAVVKVEMGVNPSV